MTEPALLKCVDCGEMFAFGAGERQFFESRHFDPPIRCKACRATRRRRREALDKSESLSDELTIGPGTAAHGLRMRTSGR